MLEQPLPGGFIGDAVRVGGTVRKTPPPDPPFVHAVLRHLESWSGSPRYLGVDDQGRDMLEFLPGSVPLTGSRTANLVSVGRLIREFHGLTAGTTLAGPHEVVCHNDLSPKNTVYRDDRAVAFLDWDLAAPGKRVHDVAHACWQFAGLGPAGPDVPEAARLIREIIDGYGLRSIRAGLVPAILWWQDRCWRGIEAGADSGDPAMSRLRSSGVIDAVRDAYTWTQRHRQPLEAALR
ncbi:phosphotransferase [Actinoplanes derwentensis]|uniref:Phosphotransferase enzyme family protein n=1 Tax=Actinoplanes derwentensis TaxID=113562 RepID=A0A1H1Z5S0_9ACTN|nr:phosphotransferase [Actinoplanes derwentensis]GID81442.1 hypothetical protein Ade03nite_03660 [Actinoplanes derwentensis]SDT28957.1 Phosphotransferase enzyme family protein [Actinoplanes derwentensis]